tara:strand:- start:292 stop:465 length:174 start_codon:yes stop_codon:yes gene_type:complete
MSEGGQMIRPVVPAGSVDTALKVITTQNEVTPGFFVGYQTEWESFQKEATYQVPKKP